MDWVIFLTQKHYYRCLQKQPSNPIVNNSVAMSFQTLHMSDICLINKLSSLSIHDSFFCFYDPNSKYVVLVMSFQQNVLDVVHFGQKLAIVYNSSTNPKGEQQEP